MGCCNGTLGSSGGSFGIRVGCTLGMVAFGSNREECGATLDVAVLCDGAVDSAVGAVVLENMSDSWRTARIWASPSVLNGEAGAGCKRASASIRAASAALSAEEVAGMSS